jgi:hypothetical protein
MSDQEFGNFSQWPLIKLIEKERSFTVGDLRGTEPRQSRPRRFGTAQAARMRVTSGSGPTAQGHRCYSAVIAQMLRQKTEGHADLLLKIERCRRLAKQSRTPKPLSSF